MSDASKPVYLVDTSADPVAVRIEGRASFQNSACLQDFFAVMFKQGRSRFVLNFEHCTSMDSTFLGVLAGAGLKVRKLSPPGSLVLARVGARNLELMKNLGLHRIVTVDTGELPANLGAGAKPLQCDAKTELENARLVLEAHENLVATDEANRSKFLDVLTFLRNRVDQK